MSPTAKQVMGGREQVRVCIAQRSPAFLDRDATVQRGVAIIAEAAANGADLVVFPEVWLAGYPFWTEGWDSKLESWVAGRLRFFDEAVLVPSAATDAIAAAARAAKIHVVMGCNEVDPRPAVQTIYNSLLFFDRSGQLIGRHRKLMPTFAERMFWGQGDAQDLQVYETDIGRIGALICGENLMTPLRAAMIAMGEDFHIAVFPGCFAPQAGGELEEWDMSGNFWGHFVTRAHAVEAGAFVLCVSGYLDPADVQDGFPYKDRMNVRYARGGSQIVAPRGHPIVGPVEGSELVYADCHAWMIKAIKAIIDTAGHYSRPDVVRVMINRDDQWRPAGELYSSGGIALDRAALQRSGEKWGVDIGRIEQVADEKKLSIK